MTGSGSALEQIQNIIFSSSTGTLTKIISFWPNILAAFGVLLIGWGVSVLVYSSIVNLGDKLKLTYVTEKLKMGNLLKKANIKSHPSIIIARFLKGYIFTMFLIGAANIVHLYQIANFLDLVIAYIPRLVVALIIMLLGVQISDTTAAIVKGALRFSHTHTANIISVVAKYSLIFFSVLIALTQLNIANDLIQIVFISFCAMIALGGGLAIGLGGKDTVRELLSTLRAKDKQQLKKDQKKKK